MTTSTSRALKPDEQVSETNRTSLALYVTPREAYVMWQADPEGVHILDVRTFEEYVFGGHVEAATNIPLVFPRFDPAGPSMPGRPPGCSGEANPDFVTEAQKVCGPDDVILVYCSTGGRAAMAVNVLAQAGFTRVYNIVNGFEGDKVNDPGSVYHGKPMRNGWKNEGLPWGYNFDPELIWIAHPHAA